MLLTAILVVVPVSWFFLWMLKKLKKLGFSMISLLQEHYHAQQIRKELEEKREDIINPKGENAEEVAKAFQEVIEEAIEENEEKMLED
ncbi:MAG: hypothetical protein LBG52_03795 [Candidatus Peribacteria bacterium]|nr:hypothetical protein [Candidatus Peribacteria bacterium]